MIVNGVDVSAQINRWKQIPKTTLFREDSMLEVVIDPVQLALSFVPSLRSGAPQATLQAAMRSAP